MKRSALYLLAFAVALATPVRAADAEWAPDQASIAKIETAFAPIMAAGLTDIGDHPVKALAPLKDYSRYYAGEPRMARKSWSAHLPLDRFGKARQACTL